MRSFGKKNGNSSGNNRAFHSGSAAVQSKNVGDRIRLVPYWEKGIVKSDRLEVIIDPGVSFGSGDHPTTIMALELLEKAFPTGEKDLSGGRMLDVGTGTGVLAIAAKRLGSGITVGLDIDFAAVYSAGWNFRQNGFTGDDSVILIAGGPECLRSTFHVVAANLAAPVLVRLHQAISRVTEKLLILSGIADAMFQAVFDVYSQDFLPLIHLENSGWHSIFFERRDSGRLQVP